MIAEQMLECVEYSGDTPLIVGIEMGYGHMRPAHALACALNTGVLQADRPPLADAGECRLWSIARGVYEAASRVSQVPVVGAPLRGALNWLTRIPPLHPQRDLSRPTSSVRMLDWLGSLGLGRGMVSQLQQSGGALLTTFFAPAILAERAGCERVFCVVTDSDIARIWAPMDAHASRINYLAPSTRVSQRLQAYGVPPDRISVTGFPLPNELLGGPDLSTLQRNLAARLIRLDPRNAFRSVCGKDVERTLGAVLRTGAAGEPVTVTFAIGGAGAQANVALQLLKGFRASIESGTIRLALVAGVRRDLARRLEAGVRSVGLESELGAHVQILQEDNLEAYFSSFNALLARTDVLWTKPSELTFFGALGIPIVFSAPVGVHERYNQRWAIENAAGLRQRNPENAAEWIAEWLGDGTLAATAWAGYLRLPKRGLYSIIETIDPGVS
ncbi:MAG: hypothetical protein V2A73_13760 [Pseudomonadota bacterium]